MVRADAFAENPCSRLSDMTAILSQRKLEIVGPSIEPQKEDLSVNNLDAELKFSEHDHGGGKVVQCNEATVKLFIPDKQLAKSVEPVTGYVDDPTTYSCARPLFQPRGSLRSPYQMSDIALVSDRCLRYLFCVNWIGTKMVTVSKRRIRPPHHDLASHQPDLRNTVPIRAGDEERQQRATFVY